MEISECFVLPLFFLGSGMIVVLLMLIPELARFLKQRITTRDGGKFFASTPRARVNLYITAIYLAIFFLGYSFLPNHVEIVACGEQPRQEKQILSQFEHPWFSPPIFCRQRVPRRANRSSFLSSEQFISNFKP